MPLNTEAVELSSQAASEAFRAAFARLPKPIASERLVIRSVDFSRVKGRLQMTVKFLRPPSRRVEGVTFSISTAWAKCLRGRLGRELGKR